MSPSRVLLLTGSCNSCNDISAMSTPVELEVYLAADSPLVSMHKPDSLKSEKWREKGVGHVPLGIAEQVCSRIVYVETANRGGIQRPFG